MHARLRLPPIARSSVAPHSSQSHITRFFLASYYMRHQRSEGLAPLQSWPTYICYSLHLSSTGAPKPNCPVRSCCSKGQVIKRACNVRARSKCQTVVGRRGLPSESQCSNAPSRPLASCACLLAKIAPSSKTRVLTFHFSPPSSRSNQSTFYRGTTTWNIFHSSITANCIQPWDYTHRTSHDITHYASVITL